MAELSYAIPSPGVKIGNTKKLIASAPAPPISMLNGRARTHNLRKTNLQKSATLKWGLQGGVHGLYESVPVLCNVLRMMMWISIPDYCSWVWIPMFGHFWRRSDVKRSPKKPEGCSSYRDVDIETRLLLLSNKPNHV